MFVFMYLFIYVFVSDIMCMHMYTGNMPGCGNPDFLFTKSNYAGTIHCERHYTTPYIFIYICVTVYRDAHESFHYYGDLG